MTPDPAAVSLPNERPKIVAALVLTTSLHEAMFITAVTGQRGLARDTGRTTPQGHPQIAWAFESSSLVDEAKWLLSNIGTEKFAAVKDWDAMTREERMAVANVVSAVLSWQSSYIADCKTIAAQRQGGAR
jgi:hypothetical protein